MLPDALKLNKFPRVGTMSIHTSVIEPQIKENNFVRYVLERRGILDSDSVFTFALSVAEGNFGATLPVNTGIAALIKNCTLRLGNQVISRTQDWAHYHTVANMFAMPEERSLKHMQTQGSLSTLRPSLAHDGNLVLKDLKFSDKFNGFTPDEINLKNNPVFMIKLSDLFPALKDVQLPLGHMQDNMVVEFELNSQDDSAAQQGTLGIYTASYNGVRPSASISPDYSQMTMLADYLSYNDETHQQIQDLVDGDGLTIPFHEVVTIQGVVPAVAQPANTQEQTIVQELPLAGRSVKGILCTEQIANPNLNTDQGYQQNSMSGQYRFQAPKVETGYNVRVNDLNVYNRNVVDPGHKIVELEKVMKRPLAVNMTQYSMQIQGEGNDQNFANPLHDNEIIGKKRGVVTKITVTDIGFGYAPPPANPPNVNIDNPNIADGQAATATTTVSPQGTITEITLTHPGTGYTFPPLVTIDDPPATTPNSRKATAQTEIDTDRINNIFYDLSAGSYVEGVDLTTDPVSRRGTRILNKPIRYERKLTRTPQDYQAKTTRFFCLVEKAFAITNGGISVMA